MIFAALPNDGGSEQEQRKAHRQAWRSRGPAVATLPGITTAEVVSSQAVIQAIDPVRLKHWVRVSIPARGRVGLLKAHVPGRPAELPHDACGWKHLNYS